MRNISSADFYQGWLIEIIQVEADFRCICYSPCWEKFSSPLTCASDFEAIALAKQHIDQYYACYAIIRVLRQLYETDRLSFEEWQLLQQSLTATLKTSENHAN